MRTNERPARSGRKPPRNTTSTTTKPEVRVWGLHACMAVWEKRPEDIIKVRLTLPRRRDVQPLLDWCVANRRGFEVVSEEELEKITQSQHHEGIAMLVWKKPELSVEEMLRSKSKSGTFIYLHNVGNPHNFGAIARVAAYFGVDGIFVSGGGAFTYGAAARVAEGGLEHVPVCSVEDQREFFGAVKRQRYAVVATSPHAKQPIFGAKLPERAIFMFGSEGKGLPKPYVDKADLSVSIPGSGSVESLNVACAVTAVLSIVRFTPTRPALAQ